MPRETVTLVTANEAAELLGVTTQTIKRRYQPAGAYTRPDGRTVVLFSTKEIRGGQ